MLRNECPSCRKKFRDVKVEMVETKWYKWQKYNYYCPTCSVQLRVKKSSVALKIMIVIILLVNLFIINEYREELGPFRNLLALLPLLPYLIRDKYVLHD